MYQHMRHQFSFIKFTIKYVLISHIFSIMGVNIFYLNLVKIIKVLGLYFGPERVLDLDMQLL